MAKLEDSKLFLFFGTTGTEKEEALKRLQYWAQAKGRPQPLCVDVEERIEGFYGCGRLYEYLDQPITSFQKTDWNEAFEQISQEVQEERKQRDVYLAIHGALIRKDYGVRSVINLAEVAQLHPDAIITLIDDVFVNWHHTERRAASGQEHKGRPTLTQLLIGRRYEILIADLVVNFHQDQFGRPRKPNYVLGLRHSVETLGRLLYADNPKRVYVSLPISTPRNRQEKGDATAIKMVNSLLQEALEFQKADKNLVLFLPVTLDEMLVKTLANTISSDPQEDDSLELPLSRRWQIPEVLGQTLRDEASLPTTIKLPARQVKAIAGLIDDEIRTHDFRMIDQSEKVLVLSQYCDKEESGGVSAEISYAVMTSRKVEAYQVPEWLPNGAAWGPPSGTGPFAGGPRAEYVGYHKRLEDALKKL